MINIKADRKTYPVVIDDIVFIESLGDYTKVHLREKVLITNENISSFEERLPASDFIRAHRSYLIALKHVNSFNAEAVDVGGKELPFGRVYKQVAQSRLKAMTNIPFDE
ncbi:MAG TPA: LytTR family DNA-binding domain-containing protein [Cyclobacteriaceae bacterium]|nr:LytTR family DNA-binding domain-containing protein [Cyclobacteriaceae bacterium]